MPALLPTTVRLPPELWRTILRQATYVPDQLSTSWDYDPEDRIWEGAFGETEGGHNVQDNELNMELMTKCTVVQVCREWREIATEFLYEVIQILPDLQASHRLCTLVEALTDSASRSAEGGISYGWWTKRIMFHPTSISSDLLEHLFAILEQCHNLEILNLSTPFLITLPSGAQLRLFRLLELRFAHSLRRLDNNLYTDDPDGDVIPCISGLTSLGIRMRSETPNPLDGGSSFRNITTLTMRFPVSLNRIPSQWTFPSLKTLSLSNISRRDIAALTPFIKRHQDTLLHLCISTTWARNDDIALILSSTPYLRSLALEKCDLDSLKTINDGGSEAGMGSEAGVVLLPRLTHLGIYCDPDNQGFHPWAQDNLKEVLEGELFPVLRVIRLLSAFNPFSQPFTLSDMIKQCSQSSIRLEGPPGGFTDLSRVHPKE